MKKELAILPCVMLFLGGMAFAWADPRPGDKEADIPELTRAKRDLARKLYENVLKRESMRFLEDILPEHRYKWSRKWLEAELELSKTHEGKIVAYQAHLDRMEKLFQDYKKFYGDRFGKEADFSLVDYYRVEAKILLAKAKKR